MKTRMSVFGYATVDAYPTDNVSIQRGGREFSFEKDGKKRIIQIADEGPISKGNKYLTKELLNPFLQVIPMDKIWGGGGYNSLEELVNIKDSTDEELALLYIDPAMPSWDAEQKTDLLSDKLAEKGVESYFLGLGHMPVNIVDGRRDDKVIFKSPIEYNRIQRYHKQLIDSVVRDSSIILLNSLKDEDFAENVVNACRESGVRLVSVITRSLTPEFVLENIIPYGTNIFNYDEFGYIVNPDNKPKGDENSNIEDAIRGMEIIREKYNPTDNIYVTLGKNGVLYCENDDIYQVRLKEDVNSLVNKEILDNEKSTTGAGDHFAGAVAHYESKGYLARETAMRATMNAVRYLGYEKPLDMELDFEIIPIKQIDLSRRMLCEPIVA